MKRLITICAAAGFILIAITGLATADNTLPPPWAGEDGTVYAAWDNWTNFPGGVGTPDGMPPDEWASYPSGLPDAPEAYAIMITSPEFLETYEGRDNVIELNEDYELVFDMPNFAQNEHKEVWIQVTYYPTDSNQLPWFDVYAENMEYMTEQVFEDAVEWPDGWVTGAWSFQIWPNPEREEIKLNFSGGEGSLYPAYVDQVVIDTWCVPEPMTISFAALGSMALLRRRKK
jgi:hypothetical protein